MTQRIIAGKAEGNRDGHLTPEVLAAVTRRLSAVMETGDGPAFYAEVMKIAAATGERLSPAETKTLTDYLSKLPEPQRTILAKHFEGLRPTEIAKRVGLSLKPVCKILAKTYADLQRLLPG